MDPIETDLSDDAEHHPSDDLEVKDAQLIFTNVWNELEEEFGEENLHFTKEIILLGGAPGSGKGTNTSFIAKTRGMTCRPIVVSELLSSADAQRVKAAGGMVGDTEVISLVFRKLMAEEYRDGCILDGFPRTRVQVECLKLLVIKMNTLYRKYHNTPLASRFRKPTVHAMVLFIDEKTSIKRQLKRGREILQFNEEAEREGLPIRDIRPTDLDSDLAKRRYRVFKEKTWDALQSLKEVYHYHFIDARGDVDEVEENIRKELEYQSSLELDPETHDAIRNIPLAIDLAVHARQELVRRMDIYQLDHKGLFHRVIHLIEDRFMPIVIRHAIPGLAVVNSEDPIFEDSTALAMVIDIFAERGFKAVANVNRTSVPIRFDRTTGEVFCETKRVYRFQIRFAGSEIRRGSQ